MKPHYSPMRVWFRNMIAVVRQRPKQGCTTCAMPWRPVGSVIPWYTPGHEENPARWQMYRCGCNYQMVKLEV